jgi:uncharacterized protein YjbJ (UPF0337 family)
MTDDDDGKAREAASRAAKGSVQEAIGKLIGDDAVRDRGVEERQAGAADATAAGKPAKRRASTRT